MQNLVEGLIKSCIAALSVGTFFKHTLNRVLSSKHFNNLAVSKVLCEHGCVYRRRHENDTHVRECMNHISQHYE